MRYATVVLAGLLLAAVGCNGSSGDYMTEDRLNRGLVIVLPGIEGESGYNHAIRDGLVAGGVNWALPIYSWGVPIPGIGMLMNQMDPIGNRIRAEGVTRMIMAYQDGHPGRPVYLVGHSGGGGIAVFAAEALPEGRKVDGLVLLSASISASYDLTQALQKCRQGILNVYNLDDGALLGAGTTITGTVDGVHGASAGLEGFHSPFGGLYQHQITSGDSDPHGAATQPYFVSSYVAPWVLGGARAYASR